MDPQHIRDTQRPAAERMSHTFDPALLDRMVPIPDDPNLTTRPGYDYGAKHPTHQLQIVKVIEPEQLPTDRHDLFAKSIIRWLSVIKRKK